MPSPDPDLKDALILGSGAGGGPLALALSEAGLDVLVLEKGPRYRREDYPADEIEQVRRRPFVPRLSEEPHTVVTPKTTTPITTQIQKMIMCRSKTERLTSVTPGSIFTAHSACAEPNVNHSRRPIQTRGCRIIAGSPRCSCYPAG